MLVPQALQNTEKVRERSTEPIDDQVATMSNSLALTALSMASSPGRFSRPFAPLIPASS